MASLAKCHVCGNGDLNFLVSFEQFHQVTSDCKPWTAKGKKGCCSKCGAVQALVDGEWEKACDQIYSTYTVYHQSGGVEQQVFDANSDAGKPRSLRLLERLVSEIGLPEQGRALDIGCGNGNFLRSFSAIRPKWVLNGAEYNTLYQDQVLAIPGVEVFFSGKIEAIPGHFDFISLIHVLEHIKNPIQFLQKIAIMAPKATLLIEVPYYRDNPYELLIADHATHYTPGTLSNVLRQAGYSVNSIHTDWILKEISTVATVSPSTGSESPVNAAEEIVYLTNAIEFLTKVKNCAHDVRSQNKAFGIFGTSIGGTWLYSELNARVDFFVDEDTSRHGKKHLDIEILSPSQVPPDSTVFMPLADCIARNVAARLQNYSAATYLYYSC